MIKKTFPLLMLFLLVWEAVVYGTQASPVTEEELATLEQRMGVILERMGEMVVKMDGILERMDWLLGSIIFMWATIMAGIVVVAIKTKGRRKNV